MAKDFNKLLLIVLTYLLRIFWFVFGLITNALLLIQKLFDITKRSSKWSKPIRIDSGDYPETYSLQLAIDGQGNAIAISNQSDSIFVRHFTANTGWSAAQRIDQADNGSDNTRGTKTAPCIIPDSQKNAIAAWQEDNDYSRATGFKASTWINQLTANSGWNKAMQFNSPNKGKNVVKFAGDQQGNLVAVWSHYTKDQSQIMAQHYSLETGWGQTTQIAEHKQITHTLNIYSDHQGHYVVIWDGREDQTDTDNYIYQGQVPVYTSYYSLSNGWTPASIVKNDFEHDHINIKVAFETSGNAIMVWAHFVVATPNRYNIWAMHYDTRTGWELAREIDPGVEKKSESESESEHPQVVFDSRGNAIVVWKQPRDHKYGGIWTNRYTRDNGWEEACTISQHNADQTVPHLSISPTDIVCAVWAQKGGICTSFYIDSGWSAPKLIHNDSREYGDYAPRIAVDTNGTFIVAWLREVKFFAAFWSIVYTEDKGWGTASPFVRDYACFSESPEIKMDPTGIAHALWCTRDKDSSNEHYWSCHLKLPTIETK